MVRAKLFNADDGEAVGSRVTYGDPSISFENMHHRPVT